jgi:hypothetical protein
MRLKVLAVCDKKWCAVVADVPSDPLGTTRYLTDRGMLLRPSLEGTDPRIVAAQTIEQLLEEVTHQPIPSEVELDHDGPDQKM